MCLFISQGTSNIVMSLDGGGKNKSDDFLMKGKFFGLDFVKWLKDLQVTFDYNYRQTRVDKRAVFPCEKVGVKRGEKEGFQAVFSW